MFQEGKLFPNGYSNEEPEKIKRVLTTNIKLGTPFSQNQRTSENIKKHKNIFYIITFIVVKNSENLNGLQQNIDKIK